MKNQGKFHCLAEQCIKKFNNKANHLKCQHKDAVNPPDTVPCTGEECVYCTRQPTDKTGHRLEKCPTCPKLMRPNYLKKHHCKNVQCPKCEEIVSLKEYFYHNCQQEDQQVPFSTGDLSDTEQNIQKRRARKNMTKTNSKIVAPKLADQFEAPIEPKIKSRASVAATAQDQTQHQQTASVIQNNSNFLEEEKETPNVFGKNIQPVMSDLIAFNDQQSILQNNLYSHRDEAIEHRHRTTMQREIEAIKLSEAAKTAQTTKDVLAEVKQFYSESYKEENVLALIHEQNKLIREQRQEIKAINRQRSEDLNKYIYKDAASVSDKLRQLDPTITETTIKTLTNKANKSMPILTDLDFLPNNNQLAVSLEAVRKINSKKRQLWQIAPGQGKSRVIVTICAILNRIDPNLKEVFICFPSNILLKADQHIYSELNTAMPNLRIKCTTDIGEVTTKATESTLVILDEADQILLDQQAELPLSCKAIIGVSATKWDKEKGTEQDYLTQTLRFKVIESQIPASFHVDDGHVQSMQMIRFLEAGLGRGKLIYVDENQVENLEKQAIAKGLNVVTNTEDMNIIRAVGTHCLIVSKEEYMRGVDYRSIYGIDLMIAKQLSNKRAYEQALGRVGRYGEPCSRYMDEGLENGWNKKTQSELLGRIFQKICGKSAYDDNKSQQQSLKNMWAKKP